MAQGRGPVVIQEFARALDGGREWHIDWLGNPRQPQATESQHMLDVFLSPVFKLFKGPPHSPLATDKHEQRRVAVGVGYLPILHNRARFRSGVYVPQMPNLEIRRRLLVAPKASMMTTFVDPLGLADAGSREMPVVSIDDYALGGATSTARKSVLVALADQQGEDPYHVLIPCIEIARFFFCGSSLLARHAFSDGWDRLIWRPGCRTTGLPEGHVQVGLRKLKGNSYDNAVHLAFTLLDARTRAAIQSLPKGMQRTNENASLEPLYCDFPFNEDTEIDAEVVPVRTPVGKRQRYLVTRIFSCVRPIPFRVCLVWPEMHPGQGENFDDPELKELTISDAQKAASPADAARKVPIPTESTENGQVGELDDLQGPPAKSADEFLIAADGPDRFPGLQFVPRQLSPKQLQRYKHAAATMRGQKVAAEGASVATPHGSRLVAAAEINVEFSTASSTLRTLLHCMPILESHGVDVRLLQVHRLLDVPGATTWAGIEVAREVPDESSRRRTYRPRHLLGILVQNDEGCAVIAEIEPRPSETQGFSVGVFYFSDDTEAEDCWSGPLPTTVVQRTGWPLFDSDRREYTLMNQKVVPGERALHVGIDTPQALAARILERFLAGPDRY